MWNSTETPRPRQPGRIVDVLVPERLHRPDVDETRTAARLGPARGEVLAVGAEFIPTRLAA
jgi:hypothetical protein